MWTKLHILALHDFLLSWHFESAILNERLPFQIKAKEWWVHSDSTLSNVDLLFVFKGLSQITSTWHNREH